MTARTLTAISPAAMAAGARPCGFGAGRAFAGVAVKAQYQWLPVVASESMVRTRNGNKDTHRSRRLSESPT